jgi:hypothetical protein
MQLQNGVGAAMNKVSGIDTKPNADGDNVIEVTCADGTKIDVTIDPAAAQLLVKTLQTRLVMLAHESAKNLSFPQLQVDRVDLAHSGPTAQLMASIDQMGTVILLMSNDTLRQARSEIDRVLSYRSPSKSAH